jgi:hypothetical protein
MIPSRVSFTRAVVVFTLIPCATWVAQPICSFGIFSIRPAIRRPATLRPGW